MFAAATVFAYGCSDNFDDSALWKDIDGMYKLSLIHISEPTRRS